jgi:hypothetical protein
VSAAELRDFLARLEHALEALGDGERGEGVAVLLDLRDDVQAALAAQERPST